MIKMNIRWISVSIPSIISHIPVWMSRHRFLMSLNVPASRVARLLVVDVWVLASKSTTRNADEIVPKSIWCQLWGFGGQSGFGSFHSILLREQVEFLGNLSPKWSQCHRVKFEKMSMSIVWLHVNCLFDCHSCLWRSQVTQRPVWQRTLFQQLPSILWSACGGMCSACWSNGSRGSCVRVHSVTLKMDFLPTDLSSFVSIWILLARIFTARSFRKGWSHYHGASAPGIASAPTFAGSLRAVTAVTVTTQRQCLLTNNESELSSVTSAFHRCFFQWGQGAWHGFISRFFVQI